MISRRGIGQWPREGLGDSTRFHELDQREGLGNERRQSGFRLVQPLQQLGSRCTPSAPYASRYCWAWRAWQVRTHPGMRLTVLIQRQYQ
ncbi:hypothetical protein HaLaN_29197 [Haematococcus lacustris]|uniref:Uncharacterized protein n=1 Tax=Haematococcus lacustris TaxID=44745 RepID=A0A6A0ACD8_HAELA|nr:hypothetical protein HaLaN_29197 [Haematococcus lacustris]